MNLDIKPALAASGWTAERVGRLKSLWADGLSCSQIARQLGGGVTRNAVIGKVHRLQLPDRTPRNAGGAGQRNGFHIAARLQGRKEERDRRRYGGKLPTGRVGAVRRTRAEALLGWTPPTPPAVIPLPPTCDQVRLLDRKDHQCGWVVADETAGPDTPMCGAPKLIGEPYCAFHQMVARHGLAAVTRPGREVRAA